MRSRVVLLDDDPSICDSVGALFRSRGIDIASFQDPATFMQFWSAHLTNVPAVMIIDIRMPTISGIEVFGLMRKEGVPAFHAVVFLTGHGDIPMAVSALKNGARDFIEKPFSGNSLVDRIIVSMDEVESTFRQYENRKEGLRDDLTHREREIAERIVVGKTNSVIAHELSISVRTVEVHRANLFRKLNIRTAVELVPLMHPVGAAIPGKHAASL